MNGILIISQDRVTTRAISVRVDAKERPPMQARALVDLLGPWGAGNAPLNEQLAVGIERLIEAGALPSGARVPSERDLSAALGVSRTTVVAAYDRLRASGSLRSRRGSGTRVSWRQAVTRPPSAARPATAQAPGTGASADTGRAALAYEDDLNSENAPLQLTIGAFRAPAIVAEEIERAAADDMRSALRYFGYLPAGLPALREAVATHLTDTGLPTSPDQVVITSGAQQAIDVIARTLAGPAGSVIIENPTYPGAIAALRAAGPRLVPVPVDDQGMVVELAGLHAERRPGQLLYVVPSYHNPTGVVLSDRRREELIRVAADTGLLVVDDQTGSYLSLGGTPPPPLAVLDQADQVITIGSLSKVAWGGLRVGWIRAPRQHVTRFAMAKSELDLGSSLLSQAVAVRLLRRVDDLKAAAQASAIERHEVISSALRAALPSWSWEHPAGGICLWVKLPAGDGAAFTRLAADFGVIVRDGATLSVDGSFTDRIRIAFGEEQDRLREAVVRLTAAWRAFEPGVTASRHQAAVSV
jgi:DNA-binding transcriptional MocR family regulator